jgi:hypothetical protein
MNREINRSINSTEYHLWTDVLHAKELSHQAGNDWDRSSYVRWCIITGWTVLEMIFRQVLNNEKIGHRFKEDVNQTVEELGLPKINWGKGTWHKILHLRDVRKEYIHTKLEREKLFLDSSFADDYVNGIQEGIIAIYEHANKPLPKWVYYFEDRGWDYGDVSMAHGTVIRQGAKREDPRSIIVTYVYKGREFESEILPFDADYFKVVQDLADSIRIPISYIKVYQGGVVIFEEEVIMRGGL